MRELELVRQELSMLKLDMASVLEEKLRAEKQTEASNAKMMFYTSSVEAIRNEIEETNEEQVLAELAWIEAAREFGDIEAGREMEANQFSLAVDETRKKMKDIVEEVDYSKELETKLAVTIADTVKRFQFIASMDVLRNELKHVREKTARLRKTEEKSDLSVQNLNSKLLRAKVKLEAVSASEEKAKSIASNLSLTFDKLKTEAEAAKKEKELVCEETASINSEILKMESEIESTEEKLPSTTQELKTVKSSEAVALENLETLIENTVQARTFQSQSSSSITISKFEHKYPTGL
ncbi:protein PLASTID MOVEMENT IMPAIRED 2-like [Pyrus ussuriensis x Pyrus communis]|uniref:Protein PLASTID MOVEMENT IMPAIRED 2-like n=1 Tax=Pyrus ussuriensis x Pyrus communis TaxID=2448454 RepID=A0A5N5GEF1_9ROSA|nr:protein PLASTID MOVEMENT IMPAIRED 2-like [Pyrus ussuriensis x Pyrus communis]